jgi:LCP family protein required for cell wall assembly
MFRAGSSTPLWGIAGKAGYAVACITSAVVLMVSGYSHILVKDVSAIGGSNALVSGPSIGEQNILLMGLESRTYWNGQVLPNNILNALHAGSRQGVLYQGVGGNTTNTLILIHIPAGGGKAVGISIPRDDYVTYPQPYDGQSGGKIDEAYGLALAAKESQLEAANHSALTDQIAFQGNEAGRAAAIATVQQLTGIHIDHFAEINLWGFYELASALGGVEVCLNHPVPLDANSGFYTTHAGYQHLNAKMALAFVRQRDGLTNGDLDRTHRQQAFIDSVLHQLKTAGVLSDLGKITSLLSTASQYVITDSGWNLLDFATQMRSLTAGHISFKTAPLAPPYYETINGQDDNIINVAQVQQFVHDSFFPAPAVHKSGSTHKAAPKADPAATTVDVYNGGYTKGLASSVSTALVQAGYKASDLGNASAHQATTEVLYGSGVAGSADALATAFGVTAQPSAALPAGTVKIVLGINATTTPSFSTGSASTASGTSTPSSSPSPTAPASTNVAGGAVNAVNGIPCVN